MSIPEIEVSNKDRSIVIHASEAVEKSTALLDTSEWSSSDSERELFEAIDSIPVRGLVESDGGVGRSSTESVVKKEDGVNNGKNSELEKRVRILSDFLEIWRSSSQYYN